jgi:molybdopterin/thiamine biosynthesis adenylyltransferase
MLIHDIVLLDVHEAELRALLDTGGGIEAAAYIVFGRASIARDPWTGEGRVRLISHRVIPIVADECVSASSVHVTWSTGGFVRELARARGDQLVLGIVHSHPGGSARFSSQDDRNEAELFRAVANRNRDGAALVSLLFGGDGTLAARVWHDSGEVTSVPRIAITGAQWRVHGSLGGSGTEARIYDRQARLFGPAFNDMLRDMRIGIVGCGGTGSPVAMLLTRLGAGHLALIDPDELEVTNLNRVHGSRHADAGARKVDIIAREIDLAGLGTHVFTVPTWVGWESARDVLKSCDVIFGCTDDHDGRMLLNRLAYFYGIPLIDVGLRMHPAKPPVSYNLVARVSTIVPGHACLLCRGLVDPRRASAEDLARSNPMEFARRKAEAYVEGGGDPAPAVVTFTTEAATMAVNELIQGLTNYRTPPGMAPGRFRQFELSQDRTVSPSSRPGCKVCDARDYWGRADVDPFLYRIGS